MTSWPSSFQFRASNFIRCLRLMPKFGTEQCHCGVGVLVEVILECVLGTSRLRASDIEERKRELAGDRYCAGSAESDYEWNSEQPVLGTTYRAAARSVVVLIAAAEGRMQGISTPVSCHYHDGWNWSRDEQCSETGGALSAESPDLYGLVRPRSQRQSNFCLGE